MMKPKPVLAWARIVGGVINPNLIFGTRKWAAETGKRVVKVRIAPMRKRRK